MSPASSTRVSQALELLQMIGIPREQQNERYALTLLALADIKPRKPWKSATAPLRRITEMMDWMRDQYEVRYAPNTRETIRRQTVHQFVQHGLLLENPDQPERPARSRIRFRLSRPQNLHPLSFRHRLGNQSLDRRCTGSHDPL